LSVTPLRQYDPWNSTTGNHRLENRRAMADNVRHDPARFLKGEENEKKLCHDYRLFYPPAA
jgi:hypothetical protein